MNNTSCPNFRRNHRRIAVLLFLAPYLSFFPVAIVLLGFEGPQGYDFAFTTRWILLATAGAEFSLLFHILYLMRRVHPTPDVRVKVTYGIIFGGPLGILWSVFRLTRDPASVALCSAPARLPLKFGFDNQVRRDGVEGAQTDKWRIRHRVISVALFLAVILSPILGFVISLTSNAPNSTRAMLPFLLSGIVALFLFLGLLIQLAVVLQKTKPDKETSADVLNWFLGGLSGPLWAIFVLTRQSTKNDRDCRRDSPLSRKPEEGCSKRDDQ
jgi:hypothetical protein